MTRFIALLLLAPCLAVLGWLYWLYVRRRAANGVSAGFDAGVLVAAALTSIACCGIFYDLDYGRVGPIWKQVAAVLATWAGFNVVLLYGLALHYWLGRRHA
ncbi:MAG: hypothetical protein ACREPU_04785 [Rhodanobacteraceae bacterium]